VAFEYVIKACQPWTVMCGYNKVNGVFGSENPIFKRLRSEWKFQGLVMTDWGATNDRVEGLRAGVDLEMPGSVGACDDFIEIALSKGELTLQQLDKCVLRVLRLILTCKEQLEQESVILDNEIKTILETHHILARKAATQSIVLLKNEQNLLPLQRDVSLAVIGAFAKIPRFQGMGSSEVNAFKIDNAWERIQEYTVNARYAPGYVRLHPEGGHQELIDEAVKVASNADVAIIFCGLNEISESEAFDKSDCYLSAGHDELIEAVTQVNSNTIVVLSNGSAVLMPWERRVKSIMESWLGGQAGASATVDLLFGTSSPSGKLAQTFAERTEDIPSSKWFPGSNRQVQYREGLNVGYRYFNSSDKEALFPFGHGLTYSKFEFTNLNVQILNSPNNERQVFVSVEVENVGSVEAAEVIQCYVHDVESSVYRPYHELKGFEKVFLKPNHKENVTLILDHRAFSFWDIGSKQWILEAGSFEVQVGCSSKDIRLRTTIFLESSHVASDESKKAYPSVDYPLTRMHDTDEEFKAICGKDIPDAQTSTILHYNSIIGDTQNTILGRTLKASGLKAMLKNFRDPPEHQVKFSEEILNNTPLRGLALFSRGALTFALLDVLIHIMNGELRQALIKVPAALGSIVFGNMFVNSDKA
jgi:beta-glucosidase